MATWNEPPPPPAPTGINVFPANPEAVVCWKGNIPDQIINVDFFKFGYVDQVLTITGRYIPAVSATVSPDAPFEQQISVTTGVSTTDTDTKQFGASLGVAGSIGSIGLSISETIQHSTTWSQSTTVTNTFKLQSTKGMISGVWWQLVYDYTIDGTLAVWTNGRRDNQGHSFRSQIKKYGDRFIEAQFPAESVARFDVIAGELFKNSTKL
jgi:hypothetical protein